ncbi:hypothetical protein EV1_004684 [Malus domestica]
MVIQICVSYQLISQPRDFSRWCVYHHLTLFIGLIFEVSSLFSNVISASGLPFIPVLAVKPVIFFNDNMNGLKHYLDDSESKAETKHVREISTIRLPKEVNRRVSNKMDN